MAHAPLRSATATIANGASLSDTVNLEGRAVLRVNMPAAWTAANLTFQVSEDNATFLNLYDDAGNGYTITAAASRAIVTDPLDFYSVRYLKVRSGTAAVPVNQAAARTIELIIRMLE